MKRPLRERWPWSCVLVLVQFLGSLFEMSCTDSALDLLYLGNADREKPFLNQIWCPTLGVCLGLGTGIVLNMAKMRPVMSGIQQHVIAGILWSAGLKFLENKREAYFIEREAIYRDYVRRHPEDFPVPERRRIGDILDKSWYPIR